LSDATGACAEGVGEAAITGKFCMMASID